MFYVSDNRGPVKGSCSNHRLIGLIHNLDGFRPGFPPGVNAAIDQELTAYMICSSCLSVGMSCNPYHHSDGRYRVYAVCGFCDNVEVC